MSWISDDALSRLREAARAPDLSGTRYEPIGEIGRGGMSTVYLVEDPSLGRRVALKVLDVPDDSGDLAERLTREARVLARLEHPGIAPVHEVGTLADGRVFYVMKYVDGKRLDAYATSSAPLSERLRLFQRVVEAVAFAHDRGILHRDLKPENIMVGPFGEVLVMDWGIAKLLDAGERDDRGVRKRALGAASAAITSHGTILGTPGYMSPEQARGEVALVGARSDVYALGAVLFFLLTGTVPESGAGSATGVDVPRPLLAVCAKAMAADPADRYAAAMELHADVGRFLDGDRVLAHREGLMQKCGRLYARHRIAFWLVVTYLVVRGSMLFFTRR